MSLETLLGWGPQSEPTERTEIARILSKIEAKLRDCAAESVSLESRFDIAYEALRKCGLAALRAHGLRPDSRGGHHVLSLQTLPTTIGYAKKIRMLEEFRKQRAARLAVNNHLWPADDRSWQRRSLGCSTGCPTWSRPPVYRTEL